MRDYQKTFENFDNNKWEKVISSKICKYWGNVYDLDPGFRSAEKLFTW